MARRITPELSAQGITKNHNPMLAIVLETLESEYSLSNTSQGLSVVDHGCGKLRNVSVLRRIAKSLTLVDTEQQLLRRHSFYGETLTVKDFVGKQWPHDDICVLSDIQFQTEQLDADLVFSVCVLDAVHRRGHVQG